MATLELKEGDTLPTLTDTLNTAESLSGGSVTLYVQRTGTAELLVNDTATVTDNTAGSADVEYQFSDTQTANTGTHLAEWVVTYSDGDTETFPKDGFITVTFDAQLNRGGSVSAASASTAGPIDVLEFNEQSSAPTAPAANDWGLYIEDDGDVVKIDENGTVTAIGGGSGSAIEVLEDGTSLTTDVTKLDVLSGLTASEPAADEIDLDVDESEIDHDSLQNFNSAEHFTAASLEDGGANEIDVADFAGGLGTSGQVPQSDGSAVSWATLSAADISDVSADSVADAHHAKYTDSEARGAVEGTSDVADLVGGLGTAGQFPQTDGTNVSWVDVAFGDLTGSASLAQLSAILDANDDVEAAHLAAANLPSHATRHSDGGADELDVADLAGGAGTADQVPQSDGAAVSWGDVGLPSIDDGLDKNALDGSQGTDGQVWTSTGTGAQWEAASGGSGETTRNENTLSDAGKAALLGVDITTAKVTVIDETNDEISEWFLRGTNNDAQLLFDSNGHFTNTEDNDGTINIYHDSGNSRYEVNNETGGQITVAAIDVRET